MRLLFLLIPILCSSLAADVDTVTPSQGVTDLFQRILDVEDQLKKQLTDSVNKYKERQEQEQQKLQEAAQQLGEALKKKKADWEAKVEELKQVKLEKDAKRQKENEEIMTLLNGVYEILKNRKDEERAEVKQEINATMERIKQDYEDYKAVKLAERQAEAQFVKQALDEASSKFDEFWAQIAQAKELKKQRKQQQFEEALKTFSSLKALLEQEAVRRATAKGERLKEYNATYENYKQQIKAKYDELQAMKLDVNSGLGDVFIAKKQLQDLVKEAIKAGWKAELTEYFNEKIQSAIDKAAVKQVFDETLTSSALHGPGPVIPQQKATILDEITGTSQWQTVTWILLALSILLTVALIALIVYTLAQRRHYNEIEGHSHADSERRPILSSASGPVAPLSYTEGTKASPPPTAPEVAVPSGPSSQAF